MDFKSIERIKTLRAAASSLEGFHEAVSKTKANEPSCDKLGHGFNQDERFSAFSTKVSFDSWKGYFGNSGCSNFLSFYDSAAVSKAFVRVLNDKQVEIFRDMAKVLREEASALKDAAEKEIQKATAMLESEQ